MDQKDDRWPEPVADMAMPETNPFDPKTSLAELEKIDFYQNTLIQRENRASILFNFAGAIFIFVTLILLFFIPEIRFFISDKFREEISYMTVAWLIVGVMSVLAIVFYFLSYASVISMKNTLGRVYVQTIKRGGEIDDVMREKLFGGSLFRLPRYYYFDKLVQEILLRKHLVRLQTYGSRLWTIAIIIIIGIAAVSFSQSMSFLNQVYDSTAINFYNLWLSFYLPALSYAVSVLVLAGVLYITLIWFTKRITNAQLIEIQESIHLETLKQPGGHEAYLRDEVQRLGQRTAIVFSENQHGRNKSQKWLDKARRELEKGEKPDLSTVQTLLGSINELIIREEKQQREQRNWRVLAIFIIVVYIVGIVLAVALIPESTANKAIPILGVPPSIILWSAIGSLAVILYRFYTERDRIQLSAEVRWLIARPMIGIIMGSVAFLVFSSGLILFNAQTIQETSESGNKLALSIFYTLAFVAGFSDKFYLAIINLLIDKAPLKLGGDEEPEEDKKFNAGDETEDDTAEPSNEENSEKVEPKKVG